MTPRENLLSLWRRQGYETVGPNFGLCPSLVEEYEKRYGDEIPYPERFDFPFRNAPSLKPAERETPDWSQYYPPLKDGTAFDLWGVAREPGSADAKHMRHMRHPMENFDSLEQIEAYPWPDYEHGTEDHIRPVVEEIHAAGYAAQGGLACTIWETAWAIRGMEQLMMDMCGEDEMATFVLDKVTDSACRRAAAFARAGVDFIQLGDDIGMQSRLMMAPEFYRTWLKPRLARVVRAAKEIKPDLLIAYHSCGWVETLIPDLMEAGVQVLNPVQPECMEFDKLHAEYGDRLSFWGTVGTQTTMPFGTPDEVREVVFRNLDIAGEKGGLLPAPTHLLEPEVPWENVEAYVRACREYVTAGA